jgi:hypothetical protein
MQHVVEMSPVDGGCDAEGAYGGGGASYGYAQGGMGNMQYGWLVVAVIVAIAVYAGAFYGLPMMGMQAPDWKTSAPWYIAGAAATLAAVWATKAGGM